MWYSLICCFDETLLCDHSKHVSGSTFIRCSLFPNFKKNKNMKYFEADNLGCVCLRKSKIGFLNPKSKSSKCLTGSEGAKE